MTDIINKYYRVWQVKQLIDSSECLYRNYRSGMVDGCDAIKDKAASCKKDECPYIVEKTKDTK